MKRVGNEGVVAQGVFVLIVFNGILCGWCGAVQSGNLRGLN